MGHGRQPAGNPDAKQAIGVFDSGVGGLTVVRALMERLPFERILYFGDTARVPYGIKSSKTIQHYARQITEFLLRRNVKALVVACNTMSAVAIDSIKGLSRVPVLDVLYAGARSAARATRSKVVGIIGTPATINSNAYAQAIHGVDSSIRLFSQACALFVPLVEEGWLEHPVTRLTAVEYLKVILSHEVDTLVLGCTHYPLLKPVLQDVVGPGITLVDSAEAMAEETEGVLARMALTNPCHTAPEHQFFVTDLPLRFQAIGERFLGRTLHDVCLVEW